MTTYDAGMAVPDWPATYGYNLFLYPISTWLSGPWDLFLEHEHRLLGSFVGLVIIGLVASVFWRDKRKWVRICSVFILALVIFQGILGGVRVLALDREIAKIHGCVGPAFFAFTVAFVVFTSRYWRNVSKLEVSDHLSKRLKLISVVCWMTTVSAYLQLVVGAHIRHINVVSSPEFFSNLIVIHILLAIIVLCHGVYISFLLLRKDAANCGLRRPTGILFVLICCQVCLGVATWLVKYGTPAFVADSNLFASFTILEKGMLQSNIVTAHVAIGSLIVATSAFLSVRASRVFWYLESLDSTVAQTAANVASEKIGPVAIQKVAH